MLSLNKVASGSPCLLYTINCNKPHNRNVTLIVIPTIYTIGIRKKEFTCECNHILSKETTDIYKVLKYYLNDIALL